MEMYGERPPNMLDSSYIQNKLYIKISDSNSSGKFIF